MFSCFPLYHMELCIACYYQLCKFFHSILACPYMYEDMRICMIDKRKQKLKAEFVLILQFAPLFLLS